VFLSWSWTDIPVDMDQAPYYETELVPLLKQSKVLYFTHADSRLANNDLSDYIQQLRCRVNYRALRYSEPIRQLADTLVNRLRDDGPYLALHLRYPFTHNFVKRSSSILLTTIALHLGPADECVHVYLQI
jgi:hypothetical protein